MTPDFCCWAVIVAAGAGSRMQAGDMPKQFRELAGIPLVEWSRKAISASVSVEDSVVVLPPKEIHKWNSRMRAVAGGRTRVESVRAGLDALPPGVSHVIVHDAARPFLTPDLVDRVVKELKAGAIAVIPVVPVTDTIRQVGGPTIDRSTLSAIQTPQGFGLVALRRAHDAWRTEHGDDPTDDSQVVEAAGGAVVTVAGETRNFKITTEEDWLFSSALVRAGLESPAGSAGLPPHMGVGVDAHRFGGPGPLLIGGVEVAHSAGLAGHSDADVVLHAIGDALLGSAALGDLGLHYPESEVAKGSSSAQILQEVAEMVGAAGFAICNVDVTVIAAEPRLSPHRAAIATAIARILEIPATSVGVKATTTDGMGLTGAGEGIAAVATAMVVRRP